MIFKYTNAIYLSIPLQLTISVKIYDLLRNILFDLNIILKIEIFLSLFFLSLVNGHVLLYVSTLFS